jgi:hypothetical protein
LNICLTSSCFHSVFTKLNHHLQDFVFFVAKFTTIFLIVEFPAESCNVLYFPQDKIVRLIVEII